MNAPGATHPTGEPTVSGTSAGAPSTDATPARHGTTPPAAGTMPPGLADHPDYEVRSELGRGGMGVVYLAHNRLLGRDEVLKVMGRHIIDRPGLFDRFLREIRAVARLRHENIVAAYSAFRLGESLVFAMEYVEGYDLSRLVKSRGPLPVDYACKFVHQAALGLQHAHEYGMVHRDIKPANLMLASQRNRPVIKVLDFGLSKATRESPLDSGLTHEGQMLGTPDYIAPEQATDAQKADIRADIYSLGCTLYYLLSGGPPFHGTSLYDILQAHHSMDAKPLNFVRPEVPVELAALAAKMMAKEPRRRFQTPGEVAEALAPVFKKGGAGLKGVKPEISRAGQSGLRQETAEAAPVSPCPATPMAHNPSPMGEKSTVPSRPESRWTSLIDVQETARSAAEVPAMGRIRRPAWVWPSVAAAALLLGLIVPWSAGVFRVRPSETGSPEHRTPSVISAGAPGHAAPPAGASPRGQQPPPSDTPTKLQPAFTNSIGMGFALIPAGEFQMGSPADDDWSVANEEPQHRVRINRPFYLGATEVTRGQFRRFVDEAGYQTEAEKDGKGGRGWNQAAKKFEQDPRYTWQNAGFEQTDLHPVVNVSWNDAVAFAEWLSHKEGKTYRLPTEAEWEYACRAGTTTRYCTGDDPEGLAAVGNIADGTLKAGYPDWKYATIAARDGYIHTAPVGRYNPNAWGLFDMHGNVWEWCADRFAGDYYKRAPLDDPPGPAGTSSRVFRGGSWDRAPRTVRSATRFWSAREDRSGGKGFRVALQQPELSLPAHRDGSVTEKTADSARSVNTDAAQVTGPTNEPPRGRAREAPQNVYLSNETPIKIVVCKDWYETHGTVYRKTFLVKGKAYPHGIFAHPNSGSEATPGISELVYRLDRMWSRLCAAVAVPRMGGEQTGIVTPLTFQVIGDGRTLWESDRILEYDKPQSFDIDVSGVDILHLKVVCPGWCSYARAVWLDPFLQNPEKVPAQKGFQKPAPERVPAAGPARRAGVSRGALWRVEGDELIKEGLGHGIVKFGDRGWTDYDLTFEARKTADPDGIGVDFRTSDGKCYIMFVGGLGDKHSLNQWSDLGGRLTGIRSKPGTMQPLEWYRVQISLRGPRIRIELGNHLLFDLTDDFSRKGNVGFHSFDGGGVFRNIKVAAPDGTVLWEGPPDLHERRAERQADVDGAHIEPKPSRAQPNGSTVSRQVGHALGPRDVRPGVTPFGKPGDDQPIGLVGRGSRPRPLGPERAEPVIVWTGSRTQARQPFTR